MAAPGAAANARLLALFNQAVAHHAAGRLAVARPVYEALLRELPSHPDLLDLYGTLLHQLGEHPAADGYVRRSLARRPAAAAAWLHLGAVRRALGRPLDATIAFRRSALLTPEAAEPWVNLALMSGEAGVHAPAVSAARRALAVHPERADALVQLGASLAVLGDIGPATDALLAARRLEPLRPDLALHLPAVLAVLDRAAALRSARAGIVASPSVHELYPRLITVRDPSLDSDDGVAWARYATRLRPREARLWVNLAAEQYGAGSFAPAYREARRGCLLDPGDRAAFQNMIAAAYHLRRYEHGRRLARFCLSAHPGAADVLYALAEIELVIGDLQHAWDLYENRVGRGDAMPRAGLPPPWCGPGTEEGPLLVAAEQGIGDEVVFLSCLPDLLAAVAVPVTVEVDRRLVAVVARSFPSVRVVPRQVSPGAAGQRLLDYHDLVARHGLRHAVYAGSLPRYFRADRNRPAVRAGYLTPDPAGVARWSAALERFRPAAIVGVVWRSARMTRLREQFHARILDWAPIFETRGCAFVSLMPGDVSGEIDAVRRRLGVEIHQMDGLDAWENVDSLMALMRSLDQVVTARTANCAFAGAVGVPTIRVAPSFYRITDDRDLFFAGVTPILPRLAAFDGKAAAEAAARLLCERIGCR